MPVLPVPLIASVFEDYNGPITRDNLTEAVKERYAALAETHAHMHIPRGDLEYATEAGLRMLLLRRLVIDGPNGLAIEPDQKPVIVFYANSIRHLLEDAGISAPHPTDPA